MNFIPFFLKITNVYLETIKYRVTFFFMTLRNFYFHGTSTFYFSKSKNCTEVPKEKKIKGRVVAVVRSLHMRTYARARRRVFKFIIMSILEMKTAFEDL